MADDLVGLNINDQHEFAVHPPLRRRRAAKLIV